MQDADAQADVPRWLDTCSSRAVEQEGGIRPLYMHALLLCVQLGAKCSLMSHAQQHSRMLATVHTNDTLTLLHI